MLLRVLSLIVLLSAAGVAVIVEDSVRFSGNPKWMDHDVGPVRQISRKEADAIVSSAADAPSAIKQECMEWFSMRQGEPASAVSALKVLFPSAAVSEIVSSSARWEVQFGSAGAEEQANKKAYEAKRLGLADAGPKKTAGGWVAGLPERESEREANDDLSRAVYRGAKTARLVKTEIKSSFVRADRMPSGAYSVVEKLSDDLPGSQVRPCVSSR